MAAIGLKCALRHGSALLTFSKFLVMSPGIFDMNRAGFSLVSATFSIDDEHTEEQSESDIHTFHRGRCNLGIKGVFAVKEWLRRHSNRASIAFVQERNLHVRPFLCHRIYASEFLKHSDANSKPTRGSRPARFDLHRRAVGTFPSLVLREVITGKGLNEGSRSLCHS